MEQNQSKISKDEQTEEETYKEGPFKEERIEENEEEEPYEEEPIEEEPCEEEPIEEEPCEEEPIEEEPCEEEPIEEEPYEEEPIEEEPFEEEPIEEDPYEEEPIEEEPCEEEPIEEEPCEEEPIEEEPYEEEPIEEEPFEEEPIEKDPFEEELIKEKPLEDKPIKKEPLEENVENKTRRKHVDSSLPIRKKQKCVTWDVNLVRSVNGSLLTKSSVTPHPRPRPQCTTEAPKGVDMTRLYIANLPQCFTADELIRLFVRFGSIEKAKMVTEKTDGVNKNYGLVKFADVAHADKALKEMNGYLLEGKELYVGIVGLWKQIDAANLYVGNLPLYLNKSGLCSLFERYGTIVQANVVVDEAGVSKGYGFVKFEDPAIAAMAMACLNGHALDDKAICVRIAGAAPEHAANVAAQMTTEVIQQRDEANLYVSNLPPSLERSGLVKLFERFGPVVEARVNQDKVTKISKCSGFVRFADVAHADKALKEMNGYLLEGKELYVSIVGLWKQIDAANLYVGNLPLYLNKSGLCSLFERYGTIVQANVVVDEAGVSKGYGFVKFEDPAIAAKAIARLNGLVLEDKAICVRIAGAALEHTAKVTTQMTTEVIQQRDEANLYVSNLPPSLERSGLVKLFERFGPVVQARVNQDMVSKISKCSGFVRFSDVAHATEAIKGMNKSLVEGKVIAVKVADPPRKHLGSKPDLFVHKQSCPWGSGSSHLGSFVYGPSLAWSMAAQNEVMPYGPSQWAYESGALSSMPMPHFLGHGTTTNGANDVPLHGLNSSDIMPTPDDLANFAGFRKSMDL